MLKTRSMMRLATMAFAGLIVIPMGDHLFSHCARS